MYHTLVCNVLNSFIYLAKKHTLDTVTIKISKFYSTGRSSNHEFKPFFKLYLSDLDGWKIKIQHSSNMNVISAKAKMR